MKDSDQTPRQPADSPHGASRTCGEPDHPSPAVPVAARLLRKIQGGRFAPEDWMLLAEACGDARMRRALGHLRRITSRLVRQLAQLPAPLVRPRVLQVLNRLRLSPARWRALREALAGAGPQRQAALAIQAAAIQSAGDLWDFWHAAVEDPSRPFALPEDAFSSQLLTPLADAAALQAEGRRMANCLGNMVHEAAGGRIVCFRPRDHAFLTAELVAHEGAWKAGRILGPANADPPAALFVPVYLELQRLAACLNCRAPPPPHELETDAVQEVRAWARASYGGATLMRVAQLLGDIRGRSVSAQRAAYVIFQAGQGRYLQFLQSDGIRILGEVSSHKYEPPMQARLREPVVTLLARAGFRWPDGRRNFIQYFPVHSDEQMVALAELTLGVLGRVLRVRPGTVLALRGYIPQEHAPDPPPPGWTAGEGGLDLAGELEVEASPGG